MVVLAILLGTLSFGAKQKEHHWQQGRLLSTDEDQFYRSYVIESDTLVYAARERLRWKTAWSKPANLTINAPIRFAIEKDNMFILDEDGKEHEAKITKKILKEKK
jgi:hypothetical protein